MAVYRVYVEQIYYGHVEVEAESFENALAEAEEQFDPGIGYTPGPVALSAEKREIHKGSITWRPA